MSWSHRRRFTHDAISLAPESDFEEPEVLWKGWPMTDGRGVAAGRQEAGLGVGGQKILTGCLSVPSPDNSEKPTREPPQVHMLLNAS